MSGQIVGEVLKYAPEDLTQLEMLVLLSLAETATTKDRHAKYQTSCEQIAHRVRARPSSVKSALFTLRQRGLVVGVHEKPRRGLAQEYLLGRMTEATRKLVWSTPNGVAHTNPALAR